MSETAGLWCAVLSPFWQLEDASGLPNIKICRTSPIWKSDNKVFWCSHGRDRFEEFFSVLFPKVAVALQPEIQKEEESYVQRPETAHPTQHIPRSVPLVSMHLRHEIGLKETVAIEVPVDAEVGDLIHPLG